MAMFAFLGIALVVIVTPGQDTALTIRNTLSGGRTTGVSTALGVISGQAVWALATSVGVTALLVASEPAFVALKLAGALYLVALGAQSLVAAARGSGPRHDDDTGTPSATGRRPAAGYRQGVLSDLANPKMAVFFTSLLPQFADTFAGLLGLGLVFCALTFGWLTLYAFAVAKAGDLLRGSRARRALDAVMGAALVALGVRLATERR